MKDKKIQIKKVCGFYVNDWHFTTMILPFIRNKIEAGNKIITILQKDIKSNIEEILSKMNINKPLEEKILEINWTKTVPVKYTKIKQELTEIDGQAPNIDLLINGNKEFIEMVNQNVKKVIENSNMKSSITIVNVYDVTEFSNISEITKQHDSILNTSGIRNIEEVFEKENEKQA